MDVLNQKPNLSLYNQVFAKWFQNTFIPLLYRLGKDSQNHRELNKIAIIDAQSYANLLVAPEEQTNNDKIVDCLKEFNLYLIDEKINVRPLDTDIAQRINDWFAEFRSWIVNTQNGLSQSEEVAFIFEKKIGESLRQMDKVDNYNEQFIQMVHTSLDEQKQQALQYARNQNKQGQIHVITSFFKEIKNNLSQFLGGASKIEQKIKKFIQKLTINGDLQQETFQKLQMYIKDAKQKSGNFQGAINIGDFNYSSEQLDQDAIEAKIQADLREYINSLQNTLGAKQYLQFLFELLKKVCDIDIQEQEFLNEIMIPYYIFSRYTINQTGSQLNDGLHDNLTTKFLNWQQVRQLCVQKTLAQINESFSFNHADPNVGHINIGDTVQYLKCNKQTGFFIVNQATLSAALIGNTKYNMVRFFAKQSNFVDPAVRTTDSYISDQFMIENRNISITGYDINFPGTATVAPVVNNARLVGAVRQNQIDPDNGKIALFLQQHTPAGIALPPINTNPLFEPQNIPLDAVRVLQGAAANNTEWFRNAVSITPGAPDPGASISAAAAAAGAPVLAGNAFNNIDDANTGLQQIDTNIGLQRFMIKFLKDGIWYIIEYDFSDVKKLTWDNNNILVISRLYYYAHNIIQGFNLNNVNYYVNVPIPHMDDINDILNNLFINKQEFINTIFTLFTTMEKQSGQAGGANLIQYLTNNKTQQFTIANDIITLPIFDGNPPPPPPALPPLPGLPPLPVPVAAVGAPERVPYDNGNAYLDTMLFDLFKTVRQPLKQYLEQQINHFANVNILMVQSNYQGTQPSPNQLQLASSQDQFMFLIRGVPDVLDPVSILFTNIFKALLFSIVIRIQQFQNKSAQNDSILKYLGGNINQEPIEGAFLVYIFIPQIKQYYEQLLTRVNQFVVVLKGNDDYVQLYNQQTYEDTYFQIVNRIWQKTSGDDKLYRNKLNERSNKILKEFIRKIQEGLVIAEQIPAAQRDELQNYNNSYQGEQIINPYGTNIQTSNSNQLDQSIVYSKQQFLEKDISKYLKGNYFAKIRDQILLLIKESSINVSQLDENNNLLLESYIIQIEQAGNKKAKIQSIIQDLQGNNNDMFTSQLQNLHNTYKGYEERLSWIYGHIQNNYEENLDGFNLLSAYIACIGKHSNESQILDFIKFIYNIQDPAVINAPVIAGALPAGLLRNINFEIVTRIASIVKRQPSEEQRELTKWRLCHIIDEFIAVALAPRNLIDLYNTIAQQFFMELHAAAAGIRPAAHVLAIINEPVFDTSDSDLCAQMDITKRKYEQFANYNTLLSVLFYNYFNKAHTLDQINMRVLKYQSNQILDNYFSPVTTHDNTTDQQIFIFDGRKGSYQLNQIVNYIKLYQYDTLVNNLPKATVTETAIDISAYIKKVQLVENSLRKLIKDQLSQNPTLVKNLFEGLNGSELLDKYLCKKLQLEKQQGKYIIQSISQNPDNLVITFENKELNLQERPNKKTVMKGRMEVTNPMGTATSQVTSYVPLEILGSPAQIPQLQLILEFNRVLTTFLNTTTIDGQYDVPKQWFDPLIMQLGSLVQQVSKPMDSSQKRFIDVCVQALPQVITTPFDAQGNQAVTDGPVDVTLTGGNTLRGETLHGGVIQNNDIPCIFIQYSKEANITDTGKLSNKQINDIWVDCMRRVQQQQPQYIFDQADYTDTVTAYNQNQFPNLQAYKDFIVTWYNVTGCQQYITADYDGNTILTSLRTTEGLVANYINGNFTLATYFQQYRKVQVNDLMGLIQVAKTLDFGDIQKPHDESTILYKLLPIAWVVRKLFTFAGTKECQTSINNLPPGTMELLKQINKSYDTIIEITKDDKLSKSDLLKVTTVVDQIREVVEKNYIKVFIVQQALTINEFNDAIVQHSQNAQATFTATGLNAFIKQDIYSSQPPLNILAIQNSLGNGLLKSNDFHNGEENTGYIEPYAIKSSYINNADIRPVINAVAGPGAPGAAANMLGQNAIPQVNNRILIQDLLNYANLSNNSMKIMYLYKIFQSLYNSNYRSLISKYKNDMIDLINELQKVHKAQQTERQINIINKRLGRSELCFIRRTHLAALPTVPDLSWEMRPGGEIGPRQGGIPNNAGAGVRVAVAAKLGSVDARKAFRQNVYNSQIISQNYAIVTQLKDTIEFLQQDIPFFKNDIDNGVVLDQLNHIIPFRSEAIQTILQTFIPFANVYGSTVPAEPRAQNFFDDDGRANALITINFNNNPFSGGHYMPWDEDANNNPVVRDRGVQAGDLTIMPIGGIAFDWQYYVILGKLCGIFNTHGGAQNEATAAVEAMVQIRRGLFPSDMQFAFLFKNVLSSFYGNGYRFKLCERSDADKEVFMQYYAFLELVKVISKQLKYHVQHPASIMLLNNQNITLNNEQQNIFQFFDHVDFEFMNNGVLQDPLGQAIALHPNMEMQLDDVSYVDELELARTNGAAITDIVANQQAIANAVRALWARNLDADMQIARANLLEYDTKWDQRKDMLLGIRQYISTKSADEQIYILKGYYSTATKQAFTRNIQPGQQIYGGNIKLPQTLIVEKNPIYDDSYNYNFAESLFSTQNQTSDFKDIQRNMFNYNIGCYYQINQQLQDKATELYNKFQAAIAQHQNRQLIKYQNLSSRGKIKVAMATYIKQNSDINKLLNMTVSTMIKLSTLRGAQPLNITDFLPDEFNFGINEDIFTKLRNVATLFENILGERVIFPRINNVPFEAEAPFTAHITKYYVQHNIAPGNATAAFIPRGVGRRLYVRQQFYLSYDILTEIFRVLIEQYEQYEQAFNQNQANVQLIQNAATDQGHHINVQIQNDINAIAVAVAANAATVAPELRYSNNTQLHMNTIIYANTMEKCTNLLLNLPSTRVRNIGELANLINNNRNALPFNNQTDQANLDNVILYIEHTLIVTKDIVNTTAAAAAAPVPAAAAAPVPPVLPVPYNWDSAIPNQRKGGYALYSKYVELINKHSGYLISRQGSVPHDQTDTQGRYDSYRETQISKQLSLKRNILDLYNLIFRTDIDIYSIPSEGELYMYLAKIQDIVIQSCLLTRKQYGNNWNATQPFLHACGFTYNPAFDQIRAGLQNLTPEDIQQLSYVIQSWIVQQAPPINIATNVNVATNLLNFAAGGVPNPNDLKHILNVQQKWNLHRNLRLYGILKAGSEAQRAANIDYNYIMDFSLYNTNSNNVQQIVNNKAKMRAGLFQIFKISINTQGQAYNLTTAVGAQQDVDQLIQEIRNNVKYKLDVDNLPALPTQTDNVRAIDTFYGGGSQGAHAFYGGAITPEELQLYVQELNNILQLIQEAPAINFTLYLPTFQPGFISDRLASNNTYQSAIKDLQKDTIKNVAKQIYNLQFLLYNAKTDTFVTVSDPKVFQMTYDTLNDLTDKFMTSSNVQYLNNLNEVTYTEVDKLRVYGGLTEELENQFQNLLNNSYCTTQIRDTVNRLQSIFTTIRRDIKSSVEKTIQRFISEQFIGSRILQNMTNGELQNDALQTLYIAFVQHRNEPNDAIMNYMGQVGNYILRRYIPNDNVVHPVHEVQVLPTFYIQKRAEVQANNEIAKEFFKKQNQPMVSEAIQKILYYLNNRGFLICSRNDIEQFITKNGVVEARQLKFIHNTFRVVQFLCKHDQYHIQQYYKILFASRDLIEDVINSYVESIYFAIEGVASLEAFFCRPPVGVNRISAAKEFLIQIILNNAILNPATPAGARRAGWLGHQGNQSFLDIPGNPDWNTSYPARNLPVNLKFPGDNPRIQATALAVIATFTPQGVANMQDILYLDDYIKFDLYKNKIVQSQEILQLFYFGGEGSLQAQPLNQNTILFNAPIITTIPQVKYYIGLPRPLVALGVALVYPAGAPAPINIDHMKEFMNNRLKDDLQQHQLEYIQMYQQTLLASSVQYVPPIPPAAPALYDATDIITSTAQISNANSQKPKDALEQEKYLVHFITGLPHTIAQFREVIYQNYNKQNLVFTLTKLKPINFYSLISLNYAFTYINIPAALYDMLVVGPTSNSWQEVLTQGKTLITNQGDSITDQSYVDTKVNGMYVILK